MNKMHQAAKIAFVILALYLIAGYLPTVLLPIYMLFTGPSIEVIARYIASLIWSLLYIWLLIYFLIIKRDKWAKKIVGETEAPKSEKASAWIQVIYRLACVTAGLVFTCNITWKVITITTDYFVMQNLISDNGSIQFFSTQVLQRNLPSLIMLPLTIYLLCGAPHFVRWQVKKTLAICTEFSENEAGTKSNDLQTGE